MESWNTAQVAFLRANARLGLHELARLLGRSEPSIESAARRHRISLRRRGSRRGSVLGQPRGLSLRRDMRHALILHGDIVATRLRIDAEAELCPACTMRPIRVRVTGLCCVCHLSRLAELQHELCAEHEAQQRLWTERQRLHRIRDKVAEPEARG